MQDVNGSSDKFTKNVECADVHQLNLRREIITKQKQPVKNLLNSLQNAQKTLGSLERSLHKTCKYEQKLVKCKNSHSHSHDRYKWWDSDQSEQKSFKCNTNSKLDTDSSNSSRSKDAPTGSWSTMSIVCLQYRFEELSKRYDALLQAYDDQCSAISIRDMRLAQWRQRANLNHAQLAHAHRSLLIVGEKYLALRRKTQALKRLYQERLNRMKDILHDVVEVTVREQIRFDAKLSYCMSTERSSDAALLLYEIRKCNLLFLENIRLKTIIEELLPGQVNWN